MKKVIYILLILFSFFGFLVLAQDLTEIEFPIPELDNCTDKEECKTYCDSPDNMDVCLDFAEKHDLMPEEDIEMGRKMLELGKTEGPGGCRGIGECESYCDSIDNIKECILFAEKHDMIPEDELEEAKKVIIAIDNGLTPPSCAGKTECDVYCSTPEHMEECITFAEAAGLIPDDEIEETRKVLEAIKNGIIPPDCGGSEECDIYCSQPENIEECMDFALAAGFITEEEALMMEKTGGKGPGGCVGEEDCKIFCDEPSNMEECINFALEYGFMDPEEAESAKKMLEAGLTSGPGGCTGKEECEIYCDDISHIEECMDFAVKSGFMTAEEAEGAKRMGGMEATSSPGGCASTVACRIYCDDPANTEECMAFGEKAGLIEPGTKDMMMQGGPGGCKSKEECEDYCEDPNHLEECIKFSVEQGFMSSEEGEKALMPSTEEHREEDREEHREEEFREEEDRPEEHNREDYEERVPKDIMPEDIPEEFKEHAPSEEEIERIIEMEMQKEMEERMKEMAPGNILMPEEIIPEIIPKPVPVPEIIPEPNPETSLESSILNLINIIIDFL